MAKASPPVSPAPGSAPRKAGALRRWLPVLALVLLVALGLSLGVQRYLSLTLLAENREALRLWVTAHALLALGLYVLLYVAVVALSLPGAAVMSIAGGFLFGWQVSAPATVIAATVGAAIVFEIVKTSFGAALAERSGPFIRKMAEGFAQSAFSLLLFLRLTPVFPFWAVNAVAGLSRMPMRTFFTATALGIIPASFAFALMGSGLDRVIDAQLARYKACLAGSAPGQCSFSVELSALVSPELLWGLTGLGVISLLPLLLRWWKARRNV